MLDYFLITLLVLMITSAVIALETRNLLASVISMGAVGLLLSIAFILLGAPDIAITQIVVETLFLIILIRATVYRDPYHMPSRSQLLGGIAGLVAILLFAVFGILMFAEFPALGHSVLDRVADAPSVTYVAQGLSLTGAGNLVTAVLLDFRAYDTLGEATIMFCAIIGALVILRRKARKSVKEKDEESDVI